MFHLGKSKKDANLYSADSRTILRAKYYLMTFLRHKRRGIKLHCTYVVQLRVSRLWQYLYFMDD